MAFRTLFRGWVCALVVVAAAVGHVVAQSTAEPRIGSKDQLRITVNGVDRLATGPYVVDANGQIEYPFLGAVKLQGMTAREAGVEISKRLVAKGLLVGTPQVTVDIQPGANKQISVTGSVRNPGQIVYGGTLTLFDALVRAGMATADAGEEVLVIHPVAPAIPEAGPAAGAAAKPADPAAVASVDDTTVDVADDTDNDGMVRRSLRDVETGDPAANIVLQDGDRVFVPKAQAIFVSGNVKSPGAYAVQPGMTLLQALTLAGGVSDRGSTRGIRILRRENGKQVPVKNVTLDTAVKPGDTIIVGRRIL